MMEDTKAQVGHIRAEDAKILSEALSIFRIRIEGIVLDGGDDYKDPVAIKVYHTDEDVSCLDHQKIVCFLEDHFGDRFN